MKLYGWVLVIFIVIFPLTLILNYVFLDNSIEKINIEKTPVIYHKKENLINEFNSMGNIFSVSQFTSGLMDTDIYVGGIKYDPINSVLYLSPFSKNNYEDIKSIILAVDNDYKEKKSEYDLFGMKLPYYQLYTKNIRLKMIPKIYILNKDDFNDFEYDFLKTRYFFLSYEDYRGYSFNQVTLSALEEYGSIILDEKLLEYKNVVELIKALKENGLNTFYKLEFINFKGE
ncbi:hypothetical protein C7380_12410 [Oceanotoga teriensis]|uniref:Uncharacterized protein n=1 Tax=Oceanotoga teriensis TaxID=515440 RepID=A0AA45HHV3_9BACT|nr:hypothetical protein [Oceanotoga teriensis]PWJ87399.1 hypothetical protein C7380_12410 [Oceanotoga teriensis]